MTDIEAERRKLREELRTWERRVQRAREAGDDYAAACYQRFVDRARQRLDECQDSP